MAAHKADGASDESDSFVFVYDRRDKDSPEVKVSIGGVSNFKALKERLIKVFISILQAIFFLNSILQKIDFQIQLIRNPLSLHN
jgi:hypothetical protein